MAKARSTKHEYAAAERTKSKIEPREGESDIEYYTRLAKMADQRLVRLENLATQPGYENVKQYAYAAAMRDIESYGGASRKMRFNTKPPENSRAFREKIMDMRRFLSAPTSSKAGIDQVYQTRANAVNAKLGTDFTWEDMADFFQSGDYDRFFKDYGSKTLMQAIGVIQYTAEQVTGKVAGNQNVKANEITRRAALRMMQSPKFQRTQLRQNMSPELRDAIRDDLKKQLGDKPRKGKKKS